MTDLTEIGAIARSLMDEHGLKDWRLRWDDSLVRYGACVWGKQEISVSRHLAALNSQEQTLDTVLHEIAHALVGPGPEPHGSRWKHVAPRVGASPVACYDRTVVQPPKRWQAVCDVHGVIAERQELRQSMRRVSCQKCSSGFDPAHLVTWIDTRSGR